MADEQLLDPMTCDAMDLLLQFHADLPPKDRWPPMLRHLVQVLVAYNERALKMTPKQAADDAIERVVLIAHYLGGRYVYLPRGDVLRRAARDAVIYRLSERGLQAPELADMFRLGVNAVWDICARERRLEVGRLQGKLFA